MKRAFLTIAVMFLGLALSQGTSHGGTIAYDNAAGLGTLQNAGTSLGMDFDVTASNGILVTRLGAFDNGVSGNLIGVDGISGVTVAIFDRISELQVGPSVTFTPSNAGSQINGNAFLAISPLFLAKGFQGSIVSFNDMNYNSSGNINYFSNENDGGGQIAFVGGGRYNDTPPDNSLQYPTKVDGGPTNRYNAGTFEFSAVPEPATMTLLGIGLAGLAGYGVRRRKQRAATA